MQPTNSATSSQLLNSPQKFQSLLPSPNQPVTILTKKAGLNNSNSIHLIQQTNPVARQLLPSSNPNKGKKIAARLADQLSKLRTEVNNLDANFSNENPNEENDYDDDEDEDDDELYQAHLIKKSSSSNLMANSASQSATSTNPTKSSSNEIWLEYGCI